MKEKVIDFGNERVSVLFKKLVFPLCWNVEYVGGNDYRRDFRGTRRGQRRDCSCKYLRPLLMSLMGVGLMMGQVVP